MDRPAPTVGRRSYETRPPSPPSAMYHDPNSDRGWLSNDETPRQVARGLAHGGGSNANQADGGALAASKRLAIFGDKLSSQSGAIGRASPVPGPTQLLPPRSHSHARGDSALSNFPLTRDRDSPIPAMSSSSTLTPSKVHPSPSKGSTRTYDSKLVSREMHRLGNLAHLPAALTPSLSAGPSFVIKLSHRKSMGELCMSWYFPSSMESLCEYLCRTPRESEDLNMLVKRHISSVVSNSPPKAIATLEAEASELIGSGMDTLNGKLAGIEDNKLVGRVVELWGFFWDQVLPYVEGVLLPLQTDPILSSLYRTPKTHRNSSPTRQNGKGSMSMSSHHIPTPSQIDVRTVALRSFRDKIILPIYTRLHTRLSMVRHESFSEGHTYPRLQQMLLVLVSQGRRQITSLSLTEPASQPTPGEAAVTHLLRLVRSPASHLRFNIDLNDPRQASAHSFLAGNIPRDRRGRIAQRPGPLQMNVSEEDEEDGAETPRLGFVDRDGDREREREFLEALKSPDPPGVRQSGGWGLGAFNEDGKEKADDEDEDEQPDWDHLQADVERMVEHKDPSRVAAGLKATLHNPNVSQEAKMQAEQRLEQMGALEHEPHHGRHAESETEHQHDNRVLGGYKATLNNESTSEEAKAHAREILHAAGYGIEKPQGASEEEHRSRVIAGYKAALHNDRVSPEAKAHARDYLREQGVM
ncbi:hypothetical protein EW146_g3031 [Bondarzewia mesenterica]|uniref:HbrB-domain-containing protein n=1 Tax=Bondarzewia mesenterica TaxID=1095465 RepID=A0A4S4LZC6_9AGAM|nr:hypothetical protein EW146_g3031 [Bondarzewia mesenterica]